MTSRALPLLAVIALFGPVAAGCGVTSFTVDLSGQTTVEGDPLVVGAAMTRIPPIGSLSAINLDDHPELKKQGLTREGVQSVKVEQVRLKVLSPPSQGFDFLDELRFFVSTGDQESLVAERSGISQLDLPLPYPVLVLQTYPEELRPYLAAPTMGIVGRGSGRVPAQDVRLEAQVRLRVEPKVF